MIGNRWQSGPDTALNEERGHMRVGYVVKIEFDTCVRHSLTEASDVSLRPVCRDALVTRKGVGWR